VYGLTLHIDRGSRGGHRVTLKTTSRVECGPVRRMHATAVVVACLGLVTTGTASAAIPAGNLWKNPGAEEGSASSTGNDVFEPPEWIHENFSPATQVRYGAPNFLTAAQGAALGGGRSFFAGGPPSRYEFDPYRCSTCIWSSYKQTAIFPYDARLGAAVDAGQVQYTLSGCLGGYANQDDNVYLETVAYDEKGFQLGGFRLNGPSAAERGNVTTLLPRAQTVLVPARARSIFVRLFFVRGAYRQYNDGYADNLELRLTRAGSKPPGAACTPSARKHGKADKATDPWGTNAAAALTRVGGKITVKHGVALLKLHCGLRDAPCKGRITLAARLPRVRAQRSTATRLGSASFTIPARQTKTLRVKLKRSASKRLVRLTKKRLRRLTVSATARIGFQTTKFALAARR
jgi:hypothetical protein